MRSVRSNANKQSKQQRKEKEKKEKKLILKINDIIFEWFLINSRLCYVFFWYELIFVIFWFAAADVVGFLLLFEYFIG